MPGIGSAPMIAPVARPSNRSAGTDDRAGEVAEIGRAAPGRGPRSAGGPGGNTGHGRGADLDVAGREPAAGSTEEAHQSVARIGGIDVRARLSWLAGTVHLASGDAGNSHPRTFGAPDRPIAIPDGDRRAGEAGPAATICNSDDRSTRFPCLSAPITGRFAPRGPALSINQTGTRAASHGP